VTVAFDDYDYARALEHTESFFWSFCDDYIELVKQRAYGSRGQHAGASAQAALRIALDALLLLFAPHLPFVTEEEWSWWQHGSVHHAPWPELAFDGASDAFDLAARVLSEINKAKSAAHVTLRTEVARLVVRGSAEILALVRGVIADVQD